MQNSQLASVDLLHNPYVAFMTNATIHSVSAMMDSGFHWSDEYLASFCFLLLNATNISSPPQESSIGSLSLSDNKQSMNDSSDKVIYYESLFRKVNETTVKLCQEYNLSHAWRRPWAYG